jgi:hypothetical protein
MQLRTGRAEGIEQEVGGRKSEIRGQKAEDSEETLEVGGALRFRLEAEGRSETTRRSGDTETRRGRQKTEDIRLRPTGYAATRRAGGRGQKTAGKVGTQYCQGRMYSG